MGFLRIKERRADCASGSEMTKQAGILSKRRIKNNNFSKGIPLKGPLELSCQIFIFPGSI